MLLNCSALGYLTVSFVVVELASGWRGLEGVMELASVSFLAEVEKAVVLATLVGGAQVDDLRCCRRQIDESVNEG